MVAADKHERLEEPGLTARPVTAMRVACTSAPNFSPPDSATARSAASVIASSNGSSDRRRRQARSRDAPGPAPSGACPRRPDRSSPPSPETARACGAKSPSRFARGTSSDSTRRNHSRSRAASPSPETGRFELRTHPRQQLVGREPRQVLRVEPVELLGIEDGVAAADALEREARDELVAREASLVAAGRPAEQRQEIHHRFRQIALPLVLA